MASRGPATGGCAPAFPQPTNYTWAREEVGGCLTYTCCHTCMQVGSPLYLTDLLDTGKVQEAAHLARVGQGAGFGQVNLRFRNLSGHIW